MNCKTCKFWGYQDGYNDEIVRPLDPVSYEEMEEEDVKELYGHLVKYCTSPNILFYQRPAKDGAAVIDGSNYSGHLITSEDFGCVLYEERGRNDPK